MNKKLRILLSSPASWAPTGYSSQVAELYPLIRDEGYPLALNEAEGLIGGKVMLDGVLRYPMYNGRPGADSLVYNGRDFKADIVLTFQDSCRSIHLICRKYTIGFPVLVWTMTLHHL